MTERTGLVRSLPCVACLIGGVAQPLPSECHHLNLGGNAGQKRRGDEFTIPLCGWHHRSVPKNGCTSIDMAETYGPSLAKSSKRFREFYGTDDELLARVNALLDKTRAA